MTVKLSLYLFNYMASIIYIKCDRSFNKFVFFTAPFVSFNYNIR